MRPLRFAFAHLLHPHLPPCGDFSSSLTTTPFRRSSMRRFEARSCKPAPGGLLPSSVQHHELALVFVTQYWLPFLVDEGATMMAASTIVPVEMWMGYLIRGSSAYRPCGPTQLATPPAFSASCCPDGSLQLPRWLRFPRRSACLVVQREREP